jgi:hypothetical protein
MKKKYKILILAIGVALSIYIIYFIVDGVNSFMNTKFVEQPQDYNGFFDTENSRLTYKYTLKEGTLDPVSVYTYKRSKDDPKFGIIIFKKELKVSDIIESITFYDRRKTKSINRTYTNFLGLNELNYSYEHKEPISQLDVFIEGFKDSFVKEKTNKSIYVSFPIEKTFALTYNDSRRAIVQCRKIRSQEKEYNELAVIVKEGYAYFIYLKPFRKNTKEKLILKSLIKWD